MIKNLGFTLLIAVLFSACGQSNNQTAATAGAPADAASAPVMKFDNDAFDFGKINKGDKVHHQFAFINTGKTPLVITDGYATCGCTKPSWPRNPIKPGEKGMIDVTFDSAGKVGLQDKQVTLVANTVPARTVVHLVGEVLEKK